MIEIRVDDLAFYRGGAIVRPVNAELGATTPVQRRLEVAAGAAWRDSIQVREELPVGAAVVTGAGELDVELVVHAVVVSRMEPVTSGGVRRALTSALQRVVDFEIDAIAIAPFGLGAGNLDIEDSADAMIPLLAEHMTRARFPREVTVVVETADEERAVSHALVRAQAASSRTANGGGEA